MKLKKFIIPLGLATMFSVQTLLASSMIPVHIDGTAISFEKTAPYLSESNTVMLPLRELGNLLGIEVNWSSPLALADGIHKKSGESISIELNIKTSTLAINGIVQEKKVDASIKDGYTYLPLRLFSELFGYEVDWLDKMVYITTPEQSDNDSQTIIIQPEKPVAPGDSSLSEEPTVPDIPSIPEEPTVPDIPSIPEGPTVPDTPSIPEEPIVPDTPSIPEEPTVPDIPSIPEEPTVPDTPSIPEEPTVPDTPSIEQSVSNFERQVFTLVNQERAKYGLSPLTLDTQLSNIAREKSRDMAINNYFSHTSPTYGSPFDMLKRFGITYNSAAENIAQGYSSPEAVVKGWMNSEGHRKNILNSSFTHIGIGHYTSGNYWTQLFTKPL